MGRRGVSVYRVMIPTQHRNDVLARRIHSQAVPLTSMVERRLVQRFPLVARVFRGYVTVSMSNT
jgi:hypothetical protein